MDMSLIIVYKLNRIVLELRQNSKSTALHAKLLAPDSTRIFDVPSTEVPFYSLSNERSVVVFPSERSESIDSFVWRNGAIDRFIFLDSTWATVNRLKNLPQLKDLKFVHLRGYCLENII